MVPAAGSTVTGAVHYVLGQQHLRSGCTGIGASVAMASDGMHNQQCQPGALQLVYGT
jgi:hypothetical protein